MDVVPVLRTIRSVGTA